MSKAQIHPHALHIRISSFAITTRNLKARTKYTKCDSSACIRAPGNSHLPKLHYSMQGPAAEGEDDSACACMQGSHGPICKPFRADVSRFLDFTLRKVTCHFFGVCDLCEFSFDRRLERLGIFPGPISSPASFLVGTIVRFQSGSSFRLRQGLGRCVGRVKAGRLPMSLCYGFRDNW